MSLPEMRQHRATLIWVEVQHVLHGLRELANQLREIAIGRQHFDEHRRAADPFAELGARELRGCLGQAQIRKRKGSACVRALIDPKSKRAPTCGQHIKDITPGNPIGNIRKTLFVLRQTSLESTWHDDRNHIDGGAEGHILVP